jgi:transcription elongation factor GreA
MANDNLVTREGFDKMQAELDELKGPVRRRIADAIREAKAHGDLRENAAYHEAKLNQSRLESRIAELEKAVQLARIVERSDGTGGAHLGSKVTLIDLEFDDEFTIELVGAFEADPSKDLISIGSPLGEAIVGKKDGDEIEVVAPQGLQRYRIVSVK